MLNLYDQIQADTFISVSPSQDRLSGLRTIGVVLQLLSYAGRPASGARAN